MGKPLTIGRVANAAGVNLETVRYYQRIGLVTEPEKPEVGYRIYPFATIARIRFIKRAQQLGFKLHEVAELMELDEGHCEDVRERAEKKLIQINNQISDLSNLRTTLDSLIETCHLDGSSDHCPIIETLINFEEN
ncbi:hypothetical protein MNBD_GAMMA07-174 [hydrothermal vent metagenome]|uniref:Mercuric resistance operon regulatory protein n=1 Tax=hydrothermal vent metagenome TaxID=652676 RepID=A0A3B0WPV2_9ZZZZ